MALMVEKLISSKFYIQLRSEPKDLQTGQQMLKRMQQNPEDRCCKFQKSSF
jgi:hypothetical protein